VKYLLVIWGRLEVLFYINVFEELHNLHIANSSSNNIRVTKSMIRKYSMHEEGEECIQNFRKPEGNRPLRRSR
jgi:hypothetical protein